MYDIDPIENEKIVNSQSVKKERKTSQIMFVVLALAVGFGLGALSLGQLAPLAKQFNFLAFNSPAKTDSAVLPSNPIQSNYAPQTSQEDAVIKVVKDYSSAVVSIIITKDMPVYEQYYVSPFSDFFGREFVVPRVRQNGTEPQEIGAGSGFIVSEDGVMVTNKHVVSDASAEYTAITADGKKYPAKVLALDPSQDLAVVKITAGEGQKFPAVKLGDSSNLQIGQSVIAIGNALGEFDNTVSVGVISGLQRSIIAGGRETSETLTGLIQTDAAINEGNSGGPLLNLRGEVIGINTAIASNAQNVGFVIPVNAAKRDIEQVKNFGKITYAYLGVYTTAVNDQIQKENDLPVNYGAWITAGDSQTSPVIASSPAQKAGLKSQDIILELNGEKLTKANPLMQVIAKYNPGDKVTLKVQRQKTILDLEVTLTDRSEN